MSKRQEVTYNQTYAKYKKPALNRVLDFLYENFKPPYGWLIMVEIAVLWLFYAAWIFGQAAIVLLYLGQGVVFNAMYMAFGSISITAIILMGLWAAYAERVYNRGD